MVSSNNVAIFWDFENCRPPSSMSGYLLADGIRRIASPFGAIKAFKAYLEINSEFPSSKSCTLQSELQSSGVSLTHCPHNGRKDVADKMMIVDMLAFAIDNQAPATLLLITGDRDFAYAVSTLRLRGYEVIVILPSSTSHMSLRVQASVLFDWQRDVLGNRGSRHGCGDQDGSRGVRFSCFASVSPPKTTRDDGLDPFSPVASKTTHPKLPESQTPSPDIFVVSDSDPLPVDARGVSVDGDSLLDENFRSSCDFCGKHVVQSADIIERHDIYDDDIRTRQNPIIQRVLDTRYCRAPFTRTMSFSALVDEHDPSSSNDSRRNVDSAAVAARTRNDECDPLSDQVDDSELRVTCLRSSDGDEHPPGLCSTLIPTFSSSQNATSEDMSGSSLIPEVTKTGKPDESLRETHISTTNVFDTVYGDQGSKFRYPTNNRHRNDQSSVESFGSSCDNEALSFDTPRPSPFPPQDESSSVDEDITCAGKENALVLSAPSVLRKEQGLTTVDSHIPSMKWPQTDAHELSLSTWSLTRSTTSVRAPGMRAKDEDRFRVLIDCFKDKWTASKGKTKRILSSELATLMLKREPAVYRLAGVHKLKDYIEAARSAAIIISPGLDKNGTSWIELHSCFYTSIDDHQTGAAQSQRTSTAPLLTTTASFSNLVNRPSTSAVLSPNAGQNITPDPFVALKHLLKQLSPSAGHVLLSQLGSLIHQKHPGLYQRAGVSNLLSFLGRAESSGIVTLGSLDSSGKQWVQLIV